MSELDGKPSLPADVFRQVDKVCQAFEAAWKSSERPQLSRFLGDAQEPVRSPLLRELVLLDIEYRRQQGETPTAEDYLAQFPEEPALIEGLLRECDTLIGQQKVESPAPPRGSQWLPSSACGPQAQVEALSLAQFVESLAGSGLMTREEIQAFIDGLPPGSRPANGKRLAEEMFRQRKLTAFQARAVYQKKTRGLVLGNYAVLDRLGKGGMGQVYRAQHRRMQRVVALKVMRFAAARSKETVKRFHREARAVAKLSHPNIVTAFDADEAQGLHFLVMECVEGKDLSTLVKESGRLSVRKAVDCILQAARGLEYAHSQGIIHRDVKPANLLLDRHGTVKILDLGLAHVDEDAGSAAAAADEALTSSGEVLGTLDYMAPEQALSTKSADARSDIYSLGCTLYCLLAGRPPYHADTVAKKILAHRADPEPSLCGVRHDVPESLDRVFRQMLAKHPGDRQQGMREVILQLEACAAQEELSDARPTAVGDQETVQLPTVALREATAAAATQGTPEDDLSAGLWEEPEDRLPPWIPTSRRAAPRHVGPRRVLLGAGAGMAILLIAALAIVTFPTSRGTLVLEVNQGNARVEILDEVGNREVRRSSGDAALVVPLKTGKHRLQVEKEGFKPFARELVIGAGDRQAIAVRLERNETQAMLVISVSEVDAVVEVLDGNRKIRGEYRTGMGELRVAVEPGRFHVNVEKAGFLSFAAEGTVAAGVEKAVEIRLQPRAEEPSIPANPKGATPTPAPNTGPAAPSPEPAPPAGEARTAARPATPWLGYIVEGQGAGAVAEIAPYTNLVLDHSWIREGVTLIQAARKARLPVVLVFAGQEERGAMEKRGLALVQDNRDVVFAIGCLRADSSGLGSADFRVLRESLRRSSPGTEVWGAFSRLDADRPAPEDFDVLLIDLGIPASPEDVRHKGDEAIPKWKARAGSRPVVLLWGEGDAARDKAFDACGPPTIRMLGEIAGKHNLAGVFFQTFGTEAVLGAKKRSGIRARPELVAEIKDLARAWEIGGEGAAREAVQKP